MTEFAFDTLLAISIAATAAGAVVIRSLYASIALFIVYGLMLAVAWVRLDAIDVALAEAAIGAGLTGILLVGAAARCRAVERRAGAIADGSGERRTLLRTVQGAIAGVLAAAVGAAVLLLPDSAPGLTATVADTIERSGVSNPVTAVLLNFRGYDTLLESVVLVVALVGVWSLGAEQFWGGRPGLKQHARTDGVLAYFGRMLPLVGLLVGIHLLWAGAHAPGGAFQAGTVLAAVWLLVAMAGLRDAPPVASTRLRLMIVLGPMWFLAVGAIGAIAGSFLGLPEAFAGELILAIEVLLTLSIAVTLVLLVLGVPRRSA